MKPEYIVFVMVMFDVVIGMAYGLKGEFWRLGYWFAAAFLSFSTTRI